MVILQELFLAIDHENNNERKVDVVLCVLKLAILFLEDGDRLNNIFQKYHMLYIYSLFFYTLLPSFFLLPFIWKHFPSIISPLRLSLSLSLYIYNFSFFSCIINYPTKKSKDPSNYDNLLEKTFFSIALQTEFCSCKLPTRYFLRTECHPLLVDEVPKIIE